MRLPCVVFAVFQVASALAAGDALEVLFADAGDGFAVTGIVNRIAGETRFVTADGTAADFWELEFRTADGGSNAVFRVDNRMPARSRTERRQGTVRSFFWNGMDLPGETGALDVRADLTSGSSGMAVRWELSVRNRSRRWAIYLLQRFVQIDQISKQLFGGLASLVPDGWTPVVLKTGYVAICWLFLLALHRKKVYLKV